MPAYGKGTSGLNFNFQNKKVLADVISRIFATKNNERLYRVLIDKWDDLELFEQVEKILLEEGKPDF